MNDDLIQKYRDDILNLEEELDMSEFQSPTRKKIAIKIQVLWSVISDLYEWNDKNKDD